MSRSRSTPLVVAADDDGRHAPDGHPDWQESCALIWFDPEREIAGYQHLYLRPTDESAVRWGWHLDDTGVHASTDPAVAALPGDDLSDFEVLGWRIKTVEPLVSYDATATYGATESQISYRAVSVPLAFGIPNLDGDVQQRHYESVGRITGSYRGLLRSCDLSGVAFHDHSWGVRSRPAGGPFSHRFGFAASADTHFVINQTAGGPSSWDHSYLVHGGERAPITDIVGLADLCESAVARVLLRTEIGEHELISELTLLTTLSYRHDYRARCAFFTGTIDGSDVAGMIELAG
ncbi:MAG TPA: hypothetical protein VM282_26510 [Acidimicrobiales bacterium]|nr:hypothetical protein [Acidimicrobiales bacterium]